MMYNTYTTCGGSWYSPQRFIRCTCRAWGVPGDTNYYIGFRATREDGPPRAMRGSSWFDFREPTRCVYQAASIASYPQLSFSFRVGRAITGYILGPQEAT